MKRSLLFLMLVFVFLFYWKTGIVNHTEAEDAFEYARMVEIEGHAWLYHPHHLLYGGVAKAAYNGARALGYTGRAYSLLVLFSALSATGILFLFYRFCRRRYHFSRLAALVSTGLLAFSYGFWRYACEAEVVLPAGFFAILAVYSATAAELRMRHVVVASLVAGISVLFHVLNGIPAFAAIPLFYVLQRKFRFAVVHLVLAAFLVVLAYSLLFVFSPGQAGAHAMPPLSGRLGFALVPKGVVGFGQCLVSGNFLFGYSAFSDWLVRLFPSRMLMEELYMGGHMSLFRRGVPWISLSLLSIAILACLFRWVVARKKVGLSACMEARGWQTVAVVGLWFFAYAAALLLMEPGNPEVWVLGLVPFWLLICGLLVAPIERANELWVVLSLAIFLGVHNYAGGIAILKDPATDYNRHKASWVLENSSWDDLVVTAGNPVFVRYLRYYSSAEVLDLGFVSPEGLVEAVDCAGRVFVLNDVFEYPASLGARFPDTAKKVARFSVDLRPHVRLVAENDFGGVWEFDRGNPCVD